MREGCKRGQSSTIGIVDKVGNLGAVADAVALKLYVDMFWNMDNRPLYD